MKRSLVAMIGERIRAARLSSRHRTLTQERLAERAGISVSFLSMIERGERSAHVDTLAKISNALKIPLAELFRNERQATHRDDAVIAPLADFVRRERLTRRDVERLLAVARALFGR
jgi:transcriptional regulator with XRE-family HTH domain